MPAPSDANGLAQYARELMLQDAQLLTVIRTAEFLGYEMRITFERRAPAEPVEAEAEIDVASVELAERERRLSVAEGVPFTRAWREGQGL